MDKHQQKLLTIAYNLYCFYYKSVANTQLENMFVHKQHV